ncbi:MAG TPA: hypothetical protein VFV70_06905 [Hyphomonadaceae bacterium]|nr:hypothetical protein [Hyphomonadaceae bacterium]
MSEMANASGAGAKAQGATQAQWEAAGFGAEIAGATLLEDGAILFEEFGQGDPRRGPHSLEQRAIAAAYLASRNRWHLLDRGVDWFAVRLQYGRGLNGVTLARIFDIGDSTISSRKRAEKWPRIMSERDRMRLSRLVWLGGVMRGAGDDLQSRGRLKASSDWDLPEPLEPLTFVQDDPAGLPQQATFNRKVSDDFFSCAVERADHTLMCDKLDELVARMERDVAAGREVRDEAMVQPVGPHEGGNAELQAAEASVAAVGAGEPASS